MKNKKIKKCAEWLAYCLEIGWDKSQLDGLEKLWMDNHDEFGNFKPQLQQHSVVRQSEPFYEIVLVSGCLHTEDLKH